MKLRSAYLLLFAFVLVKAFAAPATISPAFHYSTSQAIHAASIEKQTEPGISFPGLSYVNDSDENEDNDDCTISLNSTGYLAENAFQQQGFLFHSFKNSGWNTKPVNDSYPGIFLRNRVLRI